MKTVLITGFTPFGSDIINPSYEAVKLLPDVISEAKIIKIEIPTSFNQAPQVLEKTMEKYLPDYVVCIGQAGGRTSITPEFVAINYAQAGIKDNDGNKPIHQTLVKDGPAAYFSTLPVYAIVDCMKQNGIPASVSYSAGTFVCNALMYSALHLTHTKYKNCKAGFIHVPYMHDQVTDASNNAFSMDLVDIAKGLELSINAMLENETDIVACTDGKIC